MRTIDDEGTSRSTRILVIMYSDDVISFTIRGGLAGARNRASIRGFARIDNIEGVSSLQHTV